jgi:hypothetical protein
MAPSKRLAPKTGRVLPKTWRILGMGVLGGG